MRTILFLFSLLFENIKEIYNTKTKCYPYKAHPNVLLERLGNMPTYKNGSYAARLDMSECNAAGETDFVMVDDARNISDHRPLSISIQTGCNTTSILHNNQRQQLGRQFIASSGMTLSSSSTTGKSSREFYLIRALTKSYPINNSTPLKPRRASTACTALFVAVCSRQQEELNSELGGLLDLKKVGLLSSRDHCRMIMLKRALHRRQKEILVRWKQDISVRSVNRLVRLERTNFWAAVTSFRRQTNNNTQNLKLSEFEYYKRLFSTRPDPDASTEDK